MPSNQAKISEDSVQLLGKRIALPAAKVLAILRVEGQGGQVAMRLPGSRAPLR